MSGSLHDLQHAAHAAPATATAAAVRVLEASTLPLRGAFTARVLSALANLLPDLDERTLGDATGAASDYEVLLHVLEDPAALDILQRGDPLVQARLNGLHAAAQLLDAEGGSLGVEAVAALLNMTRQGVDRRRRSGKLIGLPVGRRGYRYPAWQFDHTAKSGTIQGLEAVLAVLRGHDPWMQAAFFLNHNSWLAGQTPLMALRAGQIEPVLQAAAAYGEQSAT